MISIVFENKDVAFEALQLMKAVLDSDGYQVASEIKDQTHAVVMKKGNSMISVSYHGINPTEVRFRVEGTETVVEKLMPRFFSKFLSHLASGFYDVSLDSDFEEKLSGDMEKFIDKVKKEKEKQDKEKKDEENQEKKDEENKD